MIRIVEILLIVIILFSGCIEPEISKVEASQDPITRVDSVLPEREMLLIQPTPIQNLTQKSHEIIDYTWETSGWVNTDGAQDTGILSFENKGKNLSNVRFRFDFYKASKEFYTTKYVDIGDVNNNTIKKVRVYMPTQYYGYETWTTKKVFINIDGDWREESVLDI